MSAIERVRDEKTADVMYRHLPSWRAVGCYFAWREHYAAQQRSKEGIGRRRRDGSVLTEAGWLLPRGELNPRVLVVDEPTSLMAMAAVLEQRRADEEVTRQAEDHELAVLAEDMAIFAWQWTAIIEDDGEALEQLHEAQARSEEREAFMVRWHAANRPH